MGIPPRTFLSELIEGLTLFFSIIEMVLLVTPARREFTLGKPFELADRLQSFTDVQGGSLLML